MPKLSLKDPVTKVPLIGDSYADKLDKLGIHSVENLLHHYPARHIDRSEFTKISDLRDGQTATIMATVDDFKNVFTKYGKNLQQAKISDQTGKLTITWFNRTYLSRAITVGQTYVFSGKTKLWQNKITLTAPEFEKLDPELNNDEDFLISSNDLQTQPKADGPLAHTNYKLQTNNIHTGRLVPIYPETAGVSSKWLRSRIKAALEQTDITEHLPHDFLDYYNLKPLDECLKNIHFPGSKEAYDAAKSRLAFDELFFLQLEGAHKRYQIIKKKVGVKISLKHKQIRAFIDSLPFKLTKAQNQSVAQILEDLEKNHPMNRLLEGDVGSGKTVVAAIASFAAYLSGAKTIFMAPTEILATQHYKEFTKLFANSSVTIGLKTGTTKHQGDFDILIGTHALLFDNKKKLPTTKSRTELHSGTVTNYKLQTTNVGLVIIDEQHRFGVAQRAALESLSKNPHKLTMSATPIPRTIALTLYGDLDVSIIDELPVGRIPIKTWVVPAVKRPGAYDWIKKQIRENKAQVYVVCPLIDPSETDKLKEVRSAVDEFEKLSKIFKDFNLDLVHGRMKSSEKEAAIQKFKSGDTNILVATQVIEVGINVPSASIILIEAAERFGLAQLHQLRGRVGRGDRESYCLLFTSTQTKTDSARLSALTKHNSGFKLAEIDLKLRGPGEVFGQTQHGFDALKLASLNNHKLVAATKDAATHIIGKDPSLTNHPLLRAKINLDSTKKSTLN